MRLGPDQFAVPGIYLDAAGRHPLMPAAAAAVANYARFLSRHDHYQNLGRKEAEVRRLFAALVGTDADEIALVPGTGHAEDMVLRALGLPARDAAIVTDALHFDASLARYRRMAAAGAAVTIVPARAGGIDRDAQEDALRRGAALLVVSATSHVNGFAPDLPALCALAHRHGALVYADIVQHAGATPLDLAASGVDFAGCGTYKWLMGDMGCGFLYVRRAARDRLAGYAGVEFPHAPRFGTLGASAIEALLVSLPALIAAGPATIEAARQPLLRALDDRISALGFAPATPADSRTPIRTFSGAALTPVLGEMLRMRGIRVRVGEGTLRASVAAFNTPDDVATLAAALGEAIAAGA